VLYGLALSDQPAGAWPGHGATSGIDVKLSAPDHGTCWVGHASQYRELCFQLAGQPFVVVVEQRYQVPSRLRHTQVPRTGGADATRGAEDMIRQSGDLAGQFGAGAAIVDHDQFNAGSSALGTYAAQSPE
jgi:hypothetical protein